MKRDNRSSACNFLVKSTFPDVSKKLFTEFIVNVNTSAEKKSPHFSLTSVCQLLQQESKEESPIQTQPKKKQSEKQGIKDSKKNNANEDDHEEGDDGKDHYLIGLKTERTIAIIQLRRGQAKLLGQMEISDKFIQKKNICFHSFVYNQVQEASQLQEMINQMQSKSANSSSRPSFYQNPEQQSSSNFFLNDQTPTSPDMYICFQTGYILVMNSITSRFLYNFNLQNEKADQVWHQRRITKICTMPDQKNFLVLFTDSTLIQYGLNSKKENYEFQADINKLESQISFQPKKFGSSIQRKSYGSFEYSSISDRDFVSFACYINDEDQFCGPHKYFKFKCPSISDFAILPYSHPLYRLVNGKYSRDPLLVAYSGLDGLFRVVDIINLQAVYCFKSYYGGINSFSFEYGNELSPLISLACQDDSVIVLNTRLNIYVRIVGHSSFVSHSVFTSITPNIIRITAGSYDGSISITELLRNKLDPSDKDDANTEAYLPIKVKFQNEQAETIPITHLQKMNDEGIAYVLGFADYFLTSAFDGCASLFKYHDQAPEQLQPQMNEESNQEQTQHEQNQGDNNRSSQYSQNSSQSQNQQQQYPKRESFGGQKNSSNYQQNRRQDEDQQYNNSSYKGGSSGKVSKTSQQQQQYQPQYQQNNNNKNNQMDNEDDQDNRGDDMRQVNKKQSVSQNEKYKQGQYDDQQYQNNSGNNNNNNNYKREKRNTQERYNQS